MATAMFVGSVAAMVVMQDAIWHSPIHRYWHHDRAVEASFDSFWVGWSSPQPGVLCPNNSSRWNMTNRLAVVILLGMLLVLIAFGKGSSTEDQ
jgi:hypothetical protein